MGKTIGIILAGGTGERMGGDMPKQFVELAGKPVIAYSVETFDKSPSIDEIIIVCHGEHIGRMTDIVDGIKPRKGCSIIPGGRTRQESSYNGVKACPKDTEYVLIHDAARPLVDAGVIQRVLAGAKETGAAMPVIDIEDTVVVEEDGMVREMMDRKKLKRVQTPQGFKYDIILKAHDWCLKENIAGSTDDCGMILSISKHVEVVTGSLSNMKITSEVDLRLVEATHNGKIEY